MSSTSFAKIGNTVVNSQGIINNLSSGQLESLLVEVSLAPQSLFVTSASNLNLSLSNWATALTSPAGLGIVPYDNGAAINVNITSDAKDTAAYARKLINQFNLSSSTNPVTAQFRLTRLAGQNDDNLDDINLVNGPDGSHVYVNMRNAKTGADAATQLLLENPVGGAELLAAPAVVQIFAENFTSGSEVVTFEVQVSVNVA